MDIIDIMNIIDIIDGVDIMDILDIMDIMGIMDIMNITAWMAMSGAVSALVYQNTSITSQKHSRQYITQNVFSSETPTMVVNFTETDKN